MALCHLHESNIVHRNINLKSILLMEEKFAGDPMTAKLGDFSLSSFFAHGEGLTKQLGRPFYCAPEMIRGERYN